MRLLGGRIQDSRPGCWLVVKKRCRRVQIACDLLIKSCNRQYKCTLAVTNEAYIFNPAMRHIVTYENAAELWSMQPLYCTFAHATGTRPFRHNIVEKKTTSAHHLIASGRVCLYTCTPPKYKLPSPQVCLRSIMEAHVPEHRTISGSRYVGDICRLPTA